MFSTIISEMINGNFSFFILIVGIMQTILMVINIMLILKNKKHNSFNLDRASINRF